MNLLDTLWMWIVIVVGLIIAACWSVMIRSAEAAHGSWHDHYHDARGMLCCFAAQDCQPSHVRVVGQTAQEVLLEVDGTPVTIPQGSFHLSEDTRDWVCWRGRRHETVTQDAIRCVFIAPGS